MTFAITSLLDEPFFTGVSTSARVPRLFPVAIGAHEYLVDLTKYRRRTLPALRPPQDNQSEPGENSLNTEGFWRRTQSDWSLGAGQEFFDNEESSRRRFWTSKGVDIWTQSGLSLLYDTALREASTDTNLKTLTVNGYFYKVEGATLAHTTDPSVASPTWTAVTTTGIGSITGLATNGSTVFLSDGVKMMSSTVGSSTAADLGSLAPNFLFFANGRLIGMDADLVYDIAAAGTKTDIKDHDNASFAWKCATGAPNGIYVAGNSGDRAEVYYVGVNTTTGALLAATHAMNLPFGETINCMEHYGGVILLGTSKGFRLALISGENNGLTHGPLVEITGGVEDFDQQGQYAYFTWKNYDSTSTGIGRINLAEFTQPLVPAYATDLMATTQGTVQSVSVFASKLHFAVSGVGFYGQATTRVASGSLLSGWVRYSTVERKVVSSIDLRHDALAGSITARVDSDDGSSVTTAASSTAGTLSPSAPLAVGMFDAEMFRVNMTLTRSSTDTTTGPTLRRWTARSLVAPFRSEEFIVPLIVASKIDVSEKSTHSYDTLEEFLFLKDLESTRSTVRYQEGASTHNVYLDAIEVQPDSWTERNQFFNGVVVVRLITVEASA